MEFPKIKSIDDVQCLAWLVIANSMISANEWARVPLGNQFVVWLIDYLLFFYVIRYIYRHRSLLFTKEYLICTLYLTYAWIGVVRGLFKADNYWEYKQLVNGTLMVSLPVFVYMFRQPKIILQVLRQWNKVMPIAFLVFFWWACATSCFFFVFPFMLLYGCFFPLLPKEWKYVVGIALLLFCVDFGTRSNVIKVFTTVAVAIGYSIHQYIPGLVYKVFHHLCYIALPILLGLAAFTEFNVLTAMQDSQEDKFTTTKKNGDTENLSEDTRTFLYYEVFGSAINYDYYVFGNTPARGNESEAFVTGQYAKDEDLNGKGERFSNELVHLNIFTGLGLVGLVLYTLIYLKASYNAVFRSKNVFMKLIGCTIAFHWLFGWIEDYNSFTVQNIWLWMMIAMAYSSKFLDMPDLVFRHYFRLLFPPVFNKKNHA